jgi:hypothetical protein
MRVRRDFVDVCKRQVERGWVYDVSAKTKQKGYEMSVTFLREQLADWRNSKRIYLEYYPPANCDGLECGANRSFNPTAADAFNHAHIGIRGEEPDTVTRLVPLDNEFRGVIEFWK